MKQYPAYTLVELMIGVALFSVVLATIFSVIGARQKAQAFRDQNILVTQGLSYAYEPIAEAVKSADAIEAINTPAGCVHVRGFYITGLSGPQTEVNLSSAAPVALSANQKLVTIAAEKTFTPGIGSTNQWVKREYSLQNNDHNPDDPDPLAAGYPTVVESTYSANANFAWPTSLAGDCTASHWQAVPSLVRKLTSNQVAVTSLAVRSISPLVDVGNPIALNSPFITLVVTMTNPLARQNTVSPLSLGSTITPTFTYGERRD